MSFKSLLFLSSLLGQTSFNEAAAREFENGDVVRVKDTEIPISLENGFGPSLLGPEHQTLSRPLPNDREDSYTAKFSRVTHNATVELLNSPAWTKYQNDVKMISQLIEDVLDTYGDFGDHFGASALSNLASLDSTLRDFRETVVTAGSTLGEALNDYLDYRIEYEEFQKRIFPVAEQVYSIRWSLLDQTEKYHISFGDDLDTFVGDLYSVDVTPKAVLELLQKVRSQEKSLLDNYNELYKRISYYKSEWIDLRHTELNN